MGKAVLLTLNPPRFAQKYEATIEAIDQQEADLSLMLTTYHDSVGLLSQRIAELNDQNSDNLSWEESAELERHQDEERERLEALNHQWNERDNTRAAISQARVDAERQLDTIVPPPHREIFAVIWELC